MKTKLLEIIEEINRLKEDKISESNFEAAAGYRDTAARINNIIKDLEVIERIQPKQKVIPEMKEPPPVADGEILLGLALVEQVFEVEAGTLAGCSVKLYTLVKGDCARVYRDNNLIYDGVIDFLKQYKDYVFSVSSGDRCGLKFYDFDEIQPGDVIQSYRKKNERSKLLDKNFED